MARRSDLSFVSTRDGRRVTNGQTAREKEKREKGETAAIELYVDRDISSDFVSRIRRGPAANVTNAGDISPYVIASVLLSMMEREMTCWPIDVVLYEARARTRIKVNHQSERIEESGETKDSLSFFACVLSAALERNVRA